MLYLAFRCPFKSLLAISLKTWMGLWSILILLFLPSYYMEAKSFNSVSEKGRELVPLGGQSQVQRAMPTDRAERPTFDGDVVTTVPFTLEKDGGVQSVFRDMEAGYWKTHIGSPEVLSASMSGAEGIITQEAKATQQTSSSSVWQKLTGPWSADCDESFNAIAVHPTNRNIIYIGNSHGTKGCGLYKSTA